MDPNNAMSYRFGPFILYPSERRLERDGVPVALTPKAFDLLVLLVQRNGRLLTKDDILDHVWPDVSVTESNLTATVSMIRKALAETEENRYIENVPKKGYRFSAEIKSGSEEPQATDGLPAASEKPSIRRIVGASAVVATLVLLGVAFWLGGRRHIDQNYFEQALQHERGGDDSLALDALDRATAANPKFAQAYLKAALITYQIDQNDRANHYLKSAEALGEQQDEDFRLKAKGLRKLLEDDNDSALSQFRLASDNYPKDCDAHSMLADLAVDLGHYPEAEEGLKRCFAVDANNPQCHFTAMFLEIQRNRFDQVLERHHRLENAGQSYPYWEGPVGLAYLAKDDVPNALQHFQKLNDASLNLHGRVHFQTSKDWLAEVAAYRGRFQEEERNLTEALDSSPSQEERAEYLVALARQSTIVGDRAKAKATLAKAIETSDSPEICHQAATVFGMLGARSEAQQCLSMGGPYPLTQHEVAGLLALAEGQFEVAITELTNSYEQEEDPEIAYWLGVALMSAERWSEASQYFETIISSKGHVFADSDTVYWVLAHYEQGICYQKLQQPAKALQRYQEFLSIWKEADADLSQIRHAKHLVELLSRDSSTKQ